MDNKKLLREYVRTVLQEDDFGDDWGGFGSQKDLYNVFVKPFTDVVHTAVGKTKELSVKTQTLAKTVFETIVTTLIPTYASDYKDIFEEDKARINQIKSQYKEIYDSTWTAFKDNDILMAAFMYAPAATVTVQFARKAPIPVLNMISALTGGSFDGFLSKIKKKLSLGDTVLPLGRSVTAGPGIPEGVIREDKKKNTVDIAKILVNKKFMNAIDQNQQVQQMQKAMKGSVRKTLELVYDRAEIIAKSNSIDELQSKIGKKLPGVEKLNQLPPDQRAEMSRSIMVGVKKSLLSMYIKGLEDHIKSAVQVGVPQDHPYVGDYMATIKKIKSL